MKRLQAYKFRLKVNPRVARLFARFAGCCRYVYNRALALNEERRAKDQKRLGFVALCKELTKWRAEAEANWLADAPCHALQQSLKALERGYVNYFEGRAEPPAFKKKGRSVDSWREGDPKAFTVDAINGRIRLPKAGWVRYFNSRPVEGTPKNVTVSRRAGKWYVSVLTEREVPDPVHPHPGRAVGVDVGVVSLATLSTGEVVPPLNALRAIEKRLRGLQRSLCRKVKFSANWKKAKEKVAKLHARAANRRADHLHKLTTRLCKNHATIVVEDLSVSNMARSARGTIENPGKNVRAKSELNKSILDQGWGEMVRQLEYKAAWCGGKVLRVSPAYTSQTCPRCGLTDEGNRPTQALFSCLWCGHEDNADVNAACNVLRRGIAVVLPVEGMAKAAL